MSSKACSDLCLETSKATSMAQNPKKALRTVFFQVRSTNKMNENIWHPKPPQIITKMLRRVIRSCNRLDLKNQFGT